MPLKNPGGFVSVRSGASVLGRIHSAELERADVRIGSRVTEALLERIKMAEMRSAARRDAERLIARRAVSEGQLRERLIERGHAAAMVAGIVTIYRDAGAIDDKRLARATVERGQERGKARRAVEQELAARGIDREIIGEVSADDTDDRGGDDLTRAIDFARSRLRPSILTLPVAARQRRIAAMLARRGHDEATIESVFQTLKLADRDGDVGTRPMD